MSHFRCEYLKALTNHRGTFFNNNFYTKSLKISFLHEYTSNLVTDFDSELLTESSVNVHLEKSLLAEIVLQPLERKLR